MSLSNAKETEIRRNARWLLRLTVLTIAPYILTVCFITLIIWYPVWNIDQEGECTKPTNFFECWDIFFNYHPKTNFRKLPSDQYLIDQFKKNRDDFSEIIHQAKYHVFSGDIVEWKKKFHVERPELLGDKEPEDNKASWKFNVASTMFIKGLDDESKKMWPWVIRTKGYLYSPDNIVNGLPTALDHIIQAGKRSFRLQDQLDEDWPDNWVYNECLLRPIEANWYLFLCKQSSGG